MEAMSDKKLGEPTGEKEAESIEKTAQWISKFGMEVPAIILLETFKPLAFIAGELANFFLAPFLLLLGDEGFKFIDWFEKRENIDKFIKRLEENSEKERKARKQSKDKYKQDSLSP